MPEVELEIKFDLQPGLVFAVVATLQRDELCLSVGDSFFGEWFPCSDAKVVGDFLSCFEGVLSGQLRLIEFARDGSTFEAQLQDHATGHWKKVATWMKLRWPSIRKPTVRALRNRPMERSNGGLDKGLIADLRDTQVSDGGTTYAQACDAIQRQARTNDLPLLRALLLDESALVREAAAWPIGDLEGLTALRDLLLAYQRGLDEGHDNDGFTALLLDLITGDPPAAKQHLQALERDPDHQICENSLWLLTHCKDVGDS